MENDLLVCVGCLDSQNPADVFQNDKTERNIFPEESSVEVQSYLVRVFGVLRNHRERHSAVAKISVEDPFQT